MADKRIILPESKEQLIEKWLPVIEGKGKWESVVDGAPKVANSKYELLATQLELLEQVELKEGTSSGDVATYKPVLIPMVRRIMPSLIGNEIFGVQPLTGPTGLIFTLRSTYQNDGVNGVKRSNSVILTLADASGFDVGTSCSITGDAAVGTVRYKEGNNVLVEVVSGTFVAGDIDDAASFTAAATTISAVYENEALFKVIFKNYTGTYLTATGESLGTATREMGFEIDSKEVKANTRKLKARWTMELEDDLRAVHGMNAEQLLSGIASDEITMEMNREFIDKMDTLSESGGIIAWDYNTSDGRWEMEKYHTLIATIARVRRDIALANRRGQANFMVVTPGVLSALEATGRLNSEGTDVVSNSYVGTFQGMRVYVDIFNTVDQIIMGYKGNSEVDAGVFYCPYVPLKINKGYGEEDNIPRLFFSTRYGLDENPFGGKNYYRKITCANLPVAGAVLS